MQGPGSGDQAGPDLAGQAQPIPALLRPVRGVTFKSSGARVHSYPATIENFTRTKKIESDSVSPAHTVSIFMAWFSFKPLVTADWS